MDLRFLIPERELRAFREADLVIDLSGDMLTEDYGLHLAYSHYLPLLTAIALDRPFVLCAQSIGPFRFTRSIARFILRRASAITVREALSFDYVRDLVPDCMTLEHTADMGRASNRLD